MDMAALSLSIRRSAAVPGSRRRTRFQTQSGPPQDDSGDGDCCSEVGGQLVVSGSDAPPVFEPAEHALDEIALFVGGGVEGMEVLTGRLVGDHRLGSARGQESA